MTKKTTTAQRKPTITPALRKRAYAIIDNVQNYKYDEDTRMSIAHMVKTNDPDLAECVRRAEKGDMILDTIAAEAPYKKAAKQVIDLFEGTKVPDFLTDAVMVALQEAAAIKDINIWRPTENKEAEEFDLDTLTHLFMRTADSAFSLKPKNASERVAAAVSELLMNEETPASLFNHVADFVAEASSSDDYNKRVLWQPPAVEQLLKLAREQAKARAA